MWAGMGHMVGILSLTSYVEIHIDLYNVNTLTCIYDTIAFLFVKKYKVSNIITDHILCMMKISVFIRNFWHHNLY